MLAAVTSAALFAAEMLEFNIYLNSTLQCNANKCKHGWHESIVNEVILHSISCALIASPINNLYDH